MLVETVYDKKRGCGFRKEGGLYIKSEPMGMSHCSRIRMELNVCPVCSSGIKPSRSWTWIDPVKLVHATTGEPVYEVPCPRCRDFPGREHAVLATDDRDDEFKICGACRGRAKLDQLQLCGSGNCMTCPLGGASGPRAGLIWVGAAHYTPAEFISEMADQGASRRIPAVPKDFRPGETWVFAAHQKAWSRRCEMLTADPQTHSEDCPECDGTGEADVAAIFTAFKPSRVEYVVKGNESRDELEAMRSRGITPVNVVKVDANGDAIVMQR